jgi:hypothetical protein
MPLFHNEIGNNEWDIKESTFDTRTQSSPASYGSEDSF